MNVKDKVLKLVDQLKIVPEKLRDLPRWPKRTILIIHDMILMFLALWLGMSFRLGQFYVPEAALVPQFILAPVLAVIIFHYLSLYKFVTRYMNERYLWRIVGAVILSVLTYALIAIMFQPDRFIPRSVIILYSIFASIFLIGSRLIASWLLRDKPIGISEEHDIQKNVLIYGVGDTSFQLLNSLQRDQEYLPVGFVDDDSSIWGQKIQNLKVYPLNRLNGIIRNKAIKEIFVTLPKLSRKEREDILGQLQKLPVTVKKLPDLREIVGGKVRISDLQPVQVEDLLCREVVPPNQELLSRCVADQNVLVTGAGGSIGSELSRQVLLEKPKTLVLMDISEVALYHIDAEMVTAAKELGDETQIISVLGSVGDEQLMRETILDNKIDTLYHAAAYKHVPIVEMNAVAGLRNNTFGTQMAAKVANECKVKRFVLISTDKAVRPTNIMGASKRLAELFLQAMAGKAETTTIFTMVRFGNVLDSSGSVVKKFTEQIADGGPVTVTHPDIIRYFMSIPEAAQLVIQAGAMARGGEIYVLDMGQPVKILELARSMIHLTGLYIRDEAHPEGDIEIVYTGLRPGEKLYEELLISENTSETEHKRIFSNAEAFLSCDVLQNHLTDLEQNMNLNDVDAIRSVLADVVEGYRPAIHDDNAKIEKIS